MERGCSCCCCRGSWLPLLLLQLQLACCAERHASLWQHQVLHEQQQWGLQLLLLLPLALLVCQQRLKLLQLARQLMHAHGQQLHVLRACSRPPCSKTLWLHDFTRRRRQWMTGRHGRLVRVRRSCYDSSGLLPLQLLLALLLLLLVL